VSEVPISNTIAALFRPAKLRVSASPVANPAEEEKE
jgi:hypothetical protein